MCSYHRFNINKYLGIKRGITISFFYLFHNDNILPCSLKLRQTALNVCFSLFKNSFDIEILCLKNITVYTVHNYCSTVSICAKTSR